MNNKQYSQITFEFGASEPVQEGMAPSVGIRVKTLKNQPSVEEPDVAEEPPLEALSLAEEPALAEEPVMEEAVMEAVETMEAETATVTAPAKKQVEKKSTRGRKSLKALEAEIDLVNVPADELLFQRQYYSIGEVADMFRVNQSLLRFWENEFDIIQPRKNRKGDRHFRPVDIKNLVLIHDLLRRRKLTIEGAKDFLKKNKKVRENFAMIQSLQNIKAFLLEIKASI
jgi:DNA-binding transcriptional MerR regulator